MQSIRRGKLMHRRHETAWILFSHSMQTRGRTRCLWSVWSKNHFVLRCFSQIGRLQPIFLQQYFTLQRPPVSLHSSNAHGLVFDTKIPAGWSILNVILRYFSAISAKSGESGWTRASWILFISNSSFCMVSECSKYHFF